jgi:hypothetical protein
VFSITRGSAAFYWGHNVKTVQGENNWVTGVIAKQQFMKSTETMAMEHFGPRYALV